ncbi:MAG: EamA family transporter, partial [Planctomycetota bacterium]
GGGGAREPRAPGVRGRIFIASSIGTFLGIWLSLIAIGVLELATASTQTSTAPIFMTILVAVVWREQVTRRAWIATAIAVLGVVLLVQAS